MTDLLDLSKNLLTVKAFDFREVASKVFSGCIDWVCGVIFALAIRLKRDGTLMAYKTEAGIVYGVHIELQNQKFNCKSGYMSLNDVLSWVLHLDKHLNEMVNAIGPTSVYAVLFGIIFCETGLVVTPFLPGDSLLFAVGAICASEGSSLQLVVMIPLLIVAAVLGDAVNYWIGAKIGPKVFRSESSRFLNRKHLERAQLFYEKYGAKTIIIARFVPIVRTFAPFVAGIGKMNFGRFWLYNIVGGAVWVTLFLVAGYWFGNIEIVKKNFFLVTLGIIGVSVIPIALEWLSARRESKSNPKA